MDTHLRSYVSSSSQFRACNRVVPAAVVGVFLLAAFASPAAAQTTYRWTGNNNNNWDNAGNWGNASGYPNGINHHAQFDSQYFGNNDDVIDTRGGTFDVLGLLLGNSDVPLTFRSSAGNPGLIRINGNVRFNDNDSVFTGAHQFETNIEVVNASEWLSGFTHHVDVVGVLSGSGTITATGNEMGAGRLHSVWRSANSFTGALIIDNVYILIRDPNAFKFASVTINVDDGFRVQGNTADDFFNQTIYIGPLSGTGLLDWKSNHFVTTSDSNTTFSGTLQSTGSNSASRNFTKAGTGILTLSGQITNFGTLYNSGGGEVEILSGGTWQRIETDGGTIDIRDSATVNLANAGPNVFVVTGGAGAFVRDGADVTLTSTATSPLPRVLQTGGVLNVEGSGSTLTAPRISVGPDGGGTSLLFAEDGGSIDVDLLQIGDTAPDDGSVGEATANNGSTINADQVSLFPRGTLSISGGRAFVDQIVVGGSTEAMSLSDGANGSALNIGTSGGSSTFNNLIQDYLSGPGSISKEGAGTLTLGGANTFSGGVSVNGGTLLATNTSGSATGSGDVIVASGATLGGGGACAGNVTVQSGGSVSPGTSIGTLNVGSVTFESGSTYKVEFDQVLQAVHRDQLAVSQTATLGGTLDIANLGAFLPVETTYVILTANTLVGTFDQVIPPAGAAWRVIYDTNAGEVRVGPCFDFDGDGLCPGDDPCPSDNPDDTDGDGVCDSNDACPGFDDNADADGDGVADGCDACPGFNDNADADNDGVADGCDPCPNDNPNDSDNDGVCDSNDACPGFDDSTDSDNDGVADGCDACPGFNDNADADNDGVADGCDACPGGDDNMDTDSDGVADFCDTCPLDNPNDSDSDGVCDSNDVCPGGDDNMDSDGDGVADFCDPCPLDNPNDTDSDGVCDSSDACPGFDDNMDADNDGIPDGCDVCPGFDDNDDADNDGTPDACDPDCINFPVTVNTAQELIDAVNCANYFPDSSTIFLGADITLTAADNVTQGANGLPVISTPIVIEGQGHVLERDANAVDPFRLFFVNASGDLEIRDATMRNGVADPNVSGTYVNGGVARVSGGSMTLVDCVCTDNDGGGFGGVINAADNSSLTLERVVMSGNELSLPNGGGGAIFISGTITIRDSILSGNDGGSTGGAVYILGSGLITNTIISGNRTADFGGGIFHVNGQLTLVNCTVAGNQSTDEGGGLWTVSENTIEVVNSVLWGNASSIGAQIFKDGPSTLNLSFCGLEGGIAAVGGMFINDAGGNQTFSDTDIVFVNPIDAANAPTTDGDYHLVSNGVAVNLGDNAAATNAGLLLDIDGDDRIIGGTVDIGADEVAFCPGDADDDSDGVCNAVDLCPGFDDGIDADSDGVPDGCDACPGFDDSLDADSDGVPDGCDICPGFDDNVQSDEDDVPDGCDACPGFDDNNDMDNDGIPDACDADCTTFPVHVATTQELMDAIYCAELLPDSNTIYLDADITLTSAFAIATTIVIEGQGHVLERADVPSSFELFYVNNLGDLTLRETTLRYGASGRGGAVEVAGGTLTMTDCVVTNSSGHFGGGGIYARNNADVTLERVIMTGNLTDSGNGGALEMVGGTLAIRDSVFAGNTARAGSAISIDQVDQPLITNTIVTGNYCDGNGGAVRNKDDTLTMVNCTIVNNRGVTNGSGLFTTAGGTSTLINCIVGGNTTDSGSSSEIYTDIGGTFNMRFSALRNGFASIAGSFNDLGGNLSIGNLSEVFVNSIDGANAPTTDGDYHLVPDAVVIDQGDNTAAINAGLTTDFEGDDRIIGVTVDMGADEARCSLDGDDDGDGVCNSVDICPGFDDNVDDNNDGIPDGCDSCSGINRGDLNDDGPVDANDVPLFVQVLLDPNFGTPEQRCAADTNLDSLVDGRDIQLMVEYVLEP